MILPNKYRQSMPVECHDCRRTPLARHGFTFSGAGERQRRSLCLVSQVTLFRELNP
jgi:hypothetical protein